MDLIVGLKLVTVTYHRQGWMGGNLIFTMQEASRSVSDSTVNGGNMLSYNSFKMLTYPLAEALRLISLKSTLLKFPVANFRSK